MKIFVKTFVQTSRCALAIILLLSGQQAFSAAALTSAAAAIDNFTGLTQWSTGSCTSATNPAAINPGDTFTICTPHALTLGVAATNIAGLTVNGTLTLGTIPLALSAGSTLTNNGGTISTGGAAHVFPNIVHIAGSTNLIAATNTGMSGGVTYTQGTLVLPTSLATVSGLFSATLTPAATYGMPTTITSLAGGVAVSGGTLTLGVTNVVAGTVTMGAGGSILGVLKLKDEAHPISGTANSIAMIAKLDLSASAPTTTAATAITFAPASGAAITISGFAVPPTASITLTCTGTASGTVTSPITSTTSSTGTYTCTAAVAPTTITGLFSSGATFTMPTTITSLADGVAVTGGVLTLGVTNIVTGTVTITTGGSIAGTLKLLNAAHNINGFGSIERLDLSDITGTTTAITFTPAPAGSTITIGAFTPPGVSSAVTLICNGIRGGTLILTNGQVTNTTASGSYTCTASSVNPVSAPIFSLRGESRVFLEEVI